MTVDVAEVWPGGSLAATAMPSAFDQSTVSPFASITDDDELIYLLDADYLDSDTSETLALLPAPGASLVPGAGLPSVESVGTAGTLRVSDKGFRSAPSDSPANTPWGGRLLSAFNVRVSLFGGDTILASAAGTRGEITIGDWRSFQQNLALLSWGGRDVTLRAGRPGFALVDFGKMFCGRVRSISADAGSFRLLLRDMLTRLDVSLDLPAFAGTGGAEGPSDLGGVSRGLVLGVKHQVEAQLVNGGLQILQVSIGPITSIDAVRVRADAVETFVGDFADYAALAAATVASGEYATCLAEGLIRIGGAIDGVVTVDLIGLVGGGRTVGSCLRALATLFAGVRRNLEDPGELFERTFTALDALVPDDYGIALPAGSDENLLGLMRDRATAAGVNFGVTRDGKLFVEALRRPELPVRALTAADFDLDDGVTLQPGEPPAWEIRVGYLQSTRVLSLQEIAAGIPDDDKTRFSQAFRFASWSDASVRGRHRDARTIELLSGFATEAGAQRAADRLGGLLGRRLQAAVMPLARRHRFSFWIDPESNQVAVQLDEIGLPGTANALIGAIDQDLLSGSHALELLIDMGF